MISTKQNYKYIGLAVALAFCFLASGRVHAGIVPDSSDMGGADPDLIMVESSVPGNGILLNAPQSWTRASFSDNSANNIRFLDGCFGTSSDYQRLGGCQRSGITSTFVIYNTDSVGNATTVCRTITSTSTTGSQYVLQDGWGPYINIDSCLGTVNSQTSLRELLIRATTSGGAAMNAYKLQAQSNSGAAYAGYADGGGSPTAIQSRVTPSNDPNDGPSTGVQNRINISMRRVCDGGGPAPLNLRWQDADHADAGGNPPDEGVYFTLTIRDENNAVVDTYDSRSIWNNFGYSSHAEFIGGANDARNITFNRAGATTNIRQGYKIEWSWHNIRRINGIQVFLQYDSNFYNASRRCIPPPTPAVYTAVTTPFADFEKGSGNISVQHYVQVRSACDRNFANGANPTNVSWSTSGTGGPNGTYTFTASNCNNFTTATVTATIPAATLNGYSPGQAFSRTTTAPGSTSTITRVVYEVPYARFYGNDISAAGCTDPVSPVDGAGEPNSPNLLYGGITANRRTSNYAGAASEYAAIALTGKTNNVLTGSFQNHPSAPIRLQAFWATGNRVCPDTIYQKVTSSESLPSIVDTTITAGAYTLPTSTAGTNTYARPVAAGNVTLTGNTDARGKQTIYANGDIRITSNIQSTLTAPFDTKTAPVILIIASGNIYIDPAVTRLDAILVAQSDIYTCSNGGFGGRPQGTVHSACNSKLVVNGALNARYIHFKRSIGTRLLSTDYELSTRAQGNTTASEVVNYPYYLYFTTPYLQDKAESTFQSYFTPAPYF